MLDWLVIGGGPRGVHAAARLVGEAGVPCDAVRILDDDAALLARWRRCMRNTGMRFLRSPGVHHVGLSSASLQHSARAGRWRKLEHPYTRPFAVRLARPGRRVVLLSRHPLRMHQFDSDPGWQGPKFMAGFSRLREPDERRRRIREAQHRGSIRPTFTRRFVVKSPPVGSSSWKARWLQRVAESGRMAGRITSKSPLSRRASSPREVGAGWRAGARGGRAMNDPKTKTRRVLVIGGAVAGAHGWLWVGAGG
ncbi:MAG: hypothetical protein ACX98W_00300 [bacterium]